MEASQKMKNLNNYNNNINTNNINNNKKLKIPPKLNFQSCESLSRQKSTEQSSYFYSTRTSCKQFGRSKNHFYCSKSEVYPTERRKKYSPNNEIYDLVSTFKLNFQIILNCLDSTKLNETQKLLFQKKIQNITAKFKEFQSMKESKEKLRGVILLNSQILQENKRNTKEKEKCYESKITQINFDIEKKDIFIRKRHKKLSEIQVYIRRESQKFPKYKEIYANYSIDNFILENENMLRVRDELRSYLSEKNESISLLLSETLQLEKSNFKFYNMKDVLLLDKKKIESIRFNNFISVKNEIINDEENKIQKIQTMYEKLNYKIYKVLLDKKNNDNTLYNENGCSTIMFQQNDDVNTTNISKFFDDITIIEKNKNNDDVSGIFLSRVEDNI